MWPLTGKEPGPVSAATYDNELYGLQPGANTLAIFYDKDGGRSVSHRPCGRTCATGR